MRRSGLCVLALLAMVAPLLGQDTYAATSPSIPVQRVLLQGLDKVTARVFPIRAEVGQLIQFGTLEIIVRQCFINPPEEPPESAGFLEIVEVRPGENPQWLFRGWMFASSPALSALEHPVYDVWVVECKKADST